MENKLEQSLFRAGQYLTLIVLTHATAMTLLEGYPFGDSLWLSLTTITTVGYGDVLIHSPLGRLITVLLVYLGGIFVLAKTAADYFEYRTLKCQLKLQGQWRWSMNHHIVIISDHEDQIPHLYYQRLVKEFRQVAQYKNSAIQILTQDFSQGLPSALQTLEVTHYTGKGNDPNDLEAVNIDRAVIIIVLAKKHTDSLSDGYTFDILHRIRDRNVRASVLVECVDDRNRQRLQQAGANFTVRPIRAYPEMIVGAFCAPGSEKVIENLLTYQGEKYQRFDIPLENIQWASLVFKLIEADIGTAVAYISNQDQVHCNPPGKTLIQAQALIVIVREDRTPTLEEVKQVLMTS